MNEAYDITERECDECTVCCHTLSIDTPELVKTPNKTCVNLKDTGGCAIYETWPTICQKWFCAWRKMPNLDDSWRPDKIGVLLEFARENFPAPFTDRVGFRLTILNKEKIGKNRKVAKFIIEQINNGVPCLLSFGLDENTEPVPAFLNFALQKAVKSNNINAVLRELVKVVEVCDKRPKLTLKIEDGQLVAASE